MQIDVSKSIRFCRNLLVREREKKKEFFFDKINPKITIFHFKRHKTIRISGFLPSQLVKPVMKEARKKLYFPEMIV